MDAAFKEHIETGLTTLANAWAITRKDGVTLGFTDHDRNLQFEGILFRADSGMSASALHQTTGLSVDNAEALGALSDSAISAADIEAGRFDGAELRAWSVNWSDPRQRHLRFRGTIGEIKCAGGAFRAELRGLSEALNRPLGRVFQKPCSAVLGDHACRFDVNSPGFSTTVPVDHVESNGALRFAALAGFDEGWFQRGRLEVLDGEAKGLHGPIKQDESKADGRLITLWVPLRVPVFAGTSVRLIAGCDKRFETCRYKFNNALNFQGFPDLPSEDWLMAIPARSADLSGGSRR